MANLSDRVSFVTDGLVKLLAAVFHTVNDQRQKSVSTPLQTLNDVEGIGPDESSNQLRTLLPTMSSADRLIFEVLSDPPPITGRSRLLQDNFTFSFNTSAVVQPNVSSTQLPPATTIFDDFNSTFTQQVKWLNQLDADFTAASNNDTTQHPLVLSTSSVSLTHVVIGVAVGVATAILLVAAFAIFWHLSRKRKKSKEMVVPKTFKVSVWDEVSLHNPQTFGDFRKDSVDNLSTLDTDYYVKSLDSFTGHTKSSRPPSSVVSLREPHSPNSEQSLMPSFTSKL